MSSNFIQFYLFKATPTETEIPNEQLSCGINKYIFDQKCY